jgi:hypothetical protein
MSKPPEHKEYEKLAFQGLLKVLEHKNISRSNHKIEGVENLAPDEQKVIDFVVELSVERKRLEKVQHTTLGVGPLQKDNPPPQQKPITGETEEALADDMPAPIAEVELEDSQKKPPDLTKKLADALPTPGVETAAVDVVNPQNDKARDRLHEPTPTKTLAEKASDNNQSSLTNAPKENSDVINGPSGIPKSPLPTSDASPDLVNLKNGRAGQPYEAMIEGYTGIRIIDGGGIGLTITDDGHVSGGPIDAGEYTLMLQAIKSSQPVEIRARLSIIADPRTLWKDIPSDQNDRFAKPDKDFDFKKSEEAFIVAASVRGRSHAQEGIFRDDHFSIHADASNGWHILVVADGAGSAKLSREGSRIACDTVMESLPRYLAAEVDPKLKDFVAEYDDNLGAWAEKVRSELLYPGLPSVAQKAAASIEDAAQKQGHKPQDFSTTIVIAVSKKVSGKWFTASFTIGDGGVAIFDAKSEKVAVLCRADSGEFAGQTRFLANSEFRDSIDVLGRIFVDLREHFTVLAVMTDGITDPKFPTDAAFKKPEKWVEFWTDSLTREVTLSPENHRLEIEMLEWLDFWSRGNHDDRTIALMMPETGQCESSGEDSMSQEIANETVGVEETGASASFEEEGHNDE